MTRLALSILIIASLTTTSLLLPLKASHDISTAHESEKDTREKISINDSPKRKKRPSTRSFKGAAIATLVAGSALWQANSQTSLEDNDHQDNLILDQEKSNEDEHRQLQVNIMPPNTTVQRTPIKLGKKTNLTSSHALNKRIPPSLTTPIDHTTTSQTLVSNSALLPSPSKKKRVTFNNVVTISPRKALRIDSQRIFDPNTMSYREYFAKATSSTRKRRKGYSIGTKHELLTKPQGYNTNIHPNFINTLVKPVASSDEDSSEGDPE